MTTETNERIIKSKKRVQKHGEVFTPHKIIDLMLELPSIKECCEDLNATFLEPSAGEGAFLVEILKRKLQMVSENYNDDLVQYENYSLFALSTLYGIELLEDNAQICVMNIFKAFDEMYRIQAFKHGKNLKKNVQDSAMTIISQNIAQGNFLTRLASNGEPLVFSEWKPVLLKKGQKVIKVNRTEYTLDEIFNQTIKDLGTSSGYTYPIIEEQLNIFDLADIEDDESEEAKEKEKEMRYITVKISEVYKEEMEEIDEE